MPDLESILARLEALDRYISELDFYTQYSADEIVNDFVKYRAVQHSLQLAAQTVVDIAAHIITADFQTRARDYREMIAALGEVGVLEPDFSQQLAPIASFRNILVHDYLTIDPKQVYRYLLDRRAELRRFGQQISAYLKPYL